MSMYIKVYAAEKKYAPGLGTHIYTPAAIDLRCDLASAHFLTENVLLSFSPPPQTAVPLVISSRNFPPSSFQYKKLEPFGQFFYTASAPALNYACRRAVKIINGWCVASSGNFAFCPRSEMSNVIIPQACEWTRRRVNTSAASRGWERGGGGLKFIRFLPPPKWTRVREEDTRL